MAHLRPPRRLSVAGLTFVIVGLGLVLLEFLTDFMRPGGGDAGHIVIIVCGMGFSIWGLKQLITAWWPRPTTRVFHFRLPREGAIYLTIMCFLFIGSLVGRSNPLLMVFTALAGPFIMNGWFIFTMLRRLRVSRELPPRVMAGETFQATITLENRKFWLSIWLMTVHDRVLHRGAKLRPSVLFVNVPPARSRQGSYRLRLHDRGRYQFGPLDITTRFPLGLVERGVIIEVHDELLVYPRLGRLHPDWRRQLRHSMELVSYLRPHQGTFQDEIHRIREYRQGDDPRMIHWRTSARMNELMVCEYQESRDRDLVLIVDAWLPPQPTPYQHEEFERGLRFAATVCIDFLRYSRQSSLIVRLVGKQLVSWRGETGDTEAYALLDAFALLEPTTHTEVSRLTQGVDRDQSRQRRTMIVTTRPDVVRSEIGRSNLSQGLDLQIFGTTAEELEHIFIEE